MCFVKFLTHVETKDEALTLLSLISAFSICSLAHLYFSLRTLTGGMCGCIQSKEENENIFQKLLKHS